jgi:hypothetical protein
VNKDFSPQRHREHRDRREDRKRELKREEEYK